MFACVDGYEFWAGRDSLRPAFLFEAKLFAKFLEVTVRALDFTLNIGSRHRYGGVGRNSLMTKKLLDDNLLMCTILIEVLLIERGFLL